MALPELTLPDGTPAFQADAHSIQLVPVFGDVAMQTGHARRRRVYTVTPRVVNVAVTLTAAQMTAFDAWFEGPLQAGLQPFAALVANQGPGVLWWSARWVAPYAAEALEGGQFRVTGQLLLTGTGAATGPLATAATADIVIPLQGSAAPTLPSSPLTADITIQLTPAALFSADITIQLVVYQPASFELREDGSYELREDGSKELRD